MTTYLLLELALVVRNHFNQLTQNDETVSHTITAYANHTTTLAHIKVQQFVSQWARPVGAQQGLK